MVCCKEKINIVLLNFLNKRHFMCITRMVDVVNYEQIFNNIIEEKLSFNICIA